MTDTAPADIEDFKGGFTDFYLNGPQDSCRYADNLLIEQYGTIGKLFSRPGSNLYQPTHPQIGAGSQRIGALHFFNNSSTLLGASARDIFYYPVGGPTNILGPSSNKAFPSGTTVNNVISVTEWNAHFFATADSYTKPQQVFQDGSSVFQLRTAGLPFLASTPSVVPAGAGTTYQYLYRFLYRVDYTVGTRTFVTRGPATEVSVTSSAVISGGNAVAISAMPVLANGATDNYDTAIVVKEIYRTAADGTEFFLVHSSSNPTTTYSDTTTDATLIGNEPIYTAGGIVDNDPPPPCKLIHVTEGVGYYANYQEGSDTFPNRVRQSVPDIISAAPGSFFAEVDADIVGQSSVRGQPVLLCSKGAFRIDGRFDELGRGGMIPQRISDRCTCISSASVVQTLEGVFWWGEDGIYFTDGFSVLKINEHWPETHKSYVVNATQRRRIFGAYDTEHRRIWWAVQSDAAGTDVDTAIVLDLNWGITERSSFTRVGNGSASFAPTAVAFYSGDLYRGDSRGYTFQHSDTVYTDPLIDTLVTPSSWKRETIIYNYESCSSNFGTNFVRKYIPRISVQCKNVTNLSLQLISNNDDGKNVLPLKPIRFRGDLTWGEADAIWGDPTYIWNLSGVIKEWRRFPATSLRSSYKSISMTNAEVVIVTSDLLGNVTVDSGGETATLVDIATYDWLSDMTGYKIAFENDWDQAYDILSNTNDIVTYDDSNNSSVDGVQEWEVRGKPKGEAFFLLSYTIHFAQYGKTEDHFLASSTGEVAK